MSPWEVPVETLTTFPQGREHEAKHFKFTHGNGLGDVGVSANRLSKQTGETSHPLLAEARPDETNFSSYAPTNPYKEAGKNLLARTVLETPGPAGIRIELRDLFVTPGTTAEKVSLPGPAVLEVLGGEGKITTAENSQELAQGTSITLAQEATCSLESRGITPLVLRARIFIP